MRGSFTGAYRDKPGLLEMAPNGTLFLDEVGEMSIRMQAVLLRFLESGELQRVGADRPHTRVNVRLITATNRDLQAQIEAGTFREDLYFRLNVVRLSVPPLRERDDDVALLVRYFVESFSRTHKVATPEIAPDAMRILSEYRWPGNVRELKNVVERVVLRHGGGRIGANDLPADLLRKVHSNTLAGEVPESKPKSGLVDDLTGLMLTQGESFWAAVYPLFMARDLTRADLRRIVQTGLEQTSGNYRMLVRLFNMPEDDYKRFLSFLRKHDCHLPFQRFRTAPARISDHPPLRAVAKA
jgi:transcriptional regulator with GAF, ATPase, and Fis domain